MANKNIKEVEGGEVTALGDSDGLEIDTGSTSVWIQFLNLVKEVFKRINSLTADTSPDSADAVGTYDASAASAKQVTLANFFKVIATLTGDTTPAGGDSVVTYDTSAAASKQVLLSNLHKALTNATDTQSGTIELATSAEVLAGTDAVRAITPAGLFTVFDYFPQGTMWNGKLSVTVASNNITVALKTLAGNNPSATDPVYVRIQDSIRTITAALSVTKNAGTNWFNSGSTELATQEIDYFVYLGYNATDGVVIGFARIPFATKYGDFSATSTNETYCAISTITTAASTDYYELIGRFAATLSATAAFNWSVPTFTAINLINRPIYETRWLVYAPQWTSTGTAPSLGNGTLVGKYKLIGAEMWYHFLMIAGSTTTFGTLLYAWSLPFTLPAYTNGNHFVSGYAYDSSATTFYIGVFSVNPSASTGRIFSHAATTAVSQTVPMTWAQSDQAAASGVAVLA